MLRWAIMFLIVAIIAAVFGFGGIAAAANAIARILFFIFLVLFVAALVAGLIPTKTKLRPTTGCRYRVPGDPCPVP